MGKTLLLTLVLLTFACAAGSEDSQEKPAAMYSSLDDFCRARAAAECSDMVLQKCRVKDRNACIAARTTACKTAIPQGVKYVPIAGEACIRTVRDSYSDALLYGVELTAIQRACSTKVFGGPGLAREPCTVDYDCDGTKGLECIRAYNADEGKCLTPVQVGPGASCAGEADQCPHDFYCDQRDKICKPRPIAEEPCQPGYMPCVEAAMCSGGGPFGGSCKAKAGIGEPCRYDVDCAELACEKPSGSPNGTCASVITMSPLSAACNGFGS
jgi:hypothetical protein